MFCGHRKQSSKHQETVHQICLPDEVEAFLQLVLADGYFADPGYPAYPGFASQSIKASVFP